MGEHWDVAKHVMEDVGLFDVVELVGLAYELARRKAAIGKVVEENVVGHQRRNCHDAPAGQLLETIGEALEIGNPLRADRETLQTVQKFLAGAAWQHLRLMLEQRTPDAVLGVGIELPMLVDRVVRPYLGMLRSERVERRHPRLVAPPPFRVKDSEATVF